MSTKKSKPTTFPSNRLLVFLLNCTIVLLVSIITLLLAEFYLRLFKPQAIIPRYVTDAPYGIRMNYPNIDVWHTTPDYRINIRTNSKGVRNDREINYAKPLGKKRIIVLGDSFTVGYGVNIEDLYVTQLENRLKEAGYNVEVANLGVSGFSNAEELIMLEKEGLKYSPDLIILAYFQNDLDDNVRSGLYGISNGNLIRKNQTYLPQIKTRNFLYSSAIYRFLAEQSHLLYLIRRSISTIVKNKMLRKNESKLEYSDKKLKSKEILGAKIIDQMYLISKRNNIPFILLDVTSEGLDTNIPTDKMLYFNDMFFIESAETLKKAPPDTLLYWQRSHGHWTPYSHKVVANDLADFIIENKLLD